MIVNEVAKNVEKLFLLIQLRILSGTGGKSEDR